MPFQIVGWNGIPKLRPPQILWHARVQPLLSAPNEFSNNCVASSKLPATRGHETCSSHVSGLATINKFPSRVAIISIVFARPYFEENHTPGLHSESICKEREREAHPPARCIIMFSLFNIQPKQLSKSHNLCLLQQTKLNEVDHFPQLVGILL